MEEIMFAHRMSKIDGNFCVNILEYFISNSATFSCCYNVLSCDCLICG
jgi:hypothetical protein